MTAGVLVYVFKGAHVLLARRLSGLSINTWNGLGGPVTFGETAVKAVTRTAHEGAGISPVLSGPIGEVLYHHATHGNWKVTVFRADAFVGQPAPTATMEPQWFPVNAIPYEQMWAGDDVWLPYVVDNTPFLAELWFDADDRIIGKDVQIRRL